MLEIAHGPALLKVRIVENLGGVQYRSAGNPPPGEGRHDLALVALPGPDFDDGRERLGVLGPGRRRGEAGVGPELRRAR